ncbi:PEP-CTERM sorting domain-containing protein [Candidatus Accumulibacter aalborgensis]
MAEPLDGGAVPEPAGLSLLAAALLALRRHRRRRLAGPG